MNMFEPQRITEDLFAVPTDASHADKLNVHKDGERLGAKFALHEPAKVKSLHPLGKVYVIAGEFLSPSKVSRSRS